MTITEFRRRCVNRQRAVRVAGTYVYVHISSLMAERLFDRLNGAVTVTVDEVDSMYAFVAPATPEPDA